MSLNISVPRVGFYGFLISAALLTSSFVNAQTINEVQQLFAPERIGVSVAFDGDTAVVGAPTDGYNGVLSGSAYIFERDSGGNWIQQATLYASDGAAVDRFGASVAISGDRIIIGAEENDENGSNAGAAYIFERNGGGNWVQQAKLLASDGAVFDEFGEFVAISGDTAIVSARWDDDNGLASGSAYIFVRDSGGVWSQQAKLVPSDGASNDSFGNSVAVDGDTAVVAAHLDDDNGTSSGSVYIFVRDSGGMWSQQAKLAPSDALTFDIFGADVEISGDTVIVGATGKDDLGTNSGAAYIFVRDSGGGWSEQAKLLASDGMPFDSFGSATSISGDRAIVGVPDHDFNGSRSGTAYLFERDNMGNWSEQGKLLATNGTYYFGLGYSVAISDDASLAMAGSPGYDDGVEIGSIYVFDLPISNTPPVADAGMDQSANEGDMVMLDGSGSSDIDGDTLAYQWTQVSGPAVLLNDTMIAMPSFQAPSVGFGGEMLSFELVVQDDESSSEPDTVNVQVLNNEPLYCELAAPSMEVLSSPNHKMKEISIVGVTLPDSIGQTELVITGVTQDEPTLGEGDGEFAPDAIILDHGMLADDTVLLRQERSGTGNGRVYTITFDATDGNHTCSGSVTVSVPKSAAQPAIDDGQLYDSTQD